MKLTQNVPEGWTIDAEADWQLLCREVDGYEYDAYIEGGGTRSFDDWREHEVVGMSSRHAGSYTEHMIRPVGPVEVWVPRFLKYDRDRFLTF